MAVHSATCQECKPCPLTGDLVGLLVEVALRDPNRRVRLHALWGLHRPQDPGAVAALKSILSRDQEELARHFAGKSQEGLPVPFVWRQGYPLIKGAIAYVTCQIIDVHSVGDHTLYIGKVEHLSFAEEQASLLYYGGKYL